MANSNPQALVSRALPVPAADQGVGAVYDLSDRFGSRFIRPLTAKPAYNIADMGQYFVARNPTPGTGVADSAAPTTLSDLLGVFLLLANGDVSTSPGGGKRLYLDYIKLFCTGPGTNGTNINLTGKTDTNAVARFASGGATVTPINVNRDSAVVAVGTVNDGALVTVAANAARIVHHHQVRSVIPVIGDTYLIDFGADERQLTSMATAGTNILNTVIPAPPVIIGPQQCYLLHKWLAAQTVSGAYEFEIGWWEF